MLESLNQVLQHEHRAGDRRVEGRRQTRTRSRREQNPAVGPRAAKQATNKESNETWILPSMDPPSIRPIDSWIGVRRRAADKLGALFGPLLLTADKDLRFSAELANRLRRLANNLDAVQEAPTSVADGVVASSEAQKQDLESAQLPFHDAIVRRLDSLEKAFDLESESDRKTNYASA